MSNRGDDYFKQAEMFQYGYEGEENLEKAKYYFRLAADFGRNDAYFELGFIYACDGNYKEAIPFFEIAYENNISAAYDELLNAYLQQKEWEKYLALFLKKSHTEKECNDAIKVVDNYSNSVISSLNKNEFDLENQFIKITNWAKSSFCSEDLRKRFYQLREDILSNCIEAKIESAKNLDELQSLAYMSNKCTHLKLNQRVISKLNLKIALLEIEIAGIDSYSSLILKYKENPLIQESILLLTAKSYLYGANGAEQNVQKAIQIISEYYGSSEKAQIFYSEVLSVIEEMVDDHKYEKSSLLLNILPTNRVGKKYEIIKRIENESIINLRKSDEPEKQLELARILLFPTIRDNKDEKAGLEILNKLYKEQNNETALSLLLRHYKDDEYQIFRLCSEAFEKKLKIEQKYIDIYSKIKDEQEQKAIEKEKIKKEVEKRGINYLVHFTDEKNLESILENGILSRNRLDRMNLSYEFTDSKRKDYMRDYISTTISVPNVPMLDRVIKEWRISNPIVLYLDPSILYDPELEVIFYVTNAATNRMNYRSGRDYASFLDMFSNEINVETSENVRLLKRYNQATNKTTDIQAEVMVKDKIPADKIIKIMRYIDRKLFTYIV